jgi:gliding motility-associated-like protein
VLKFDMERFTPRGWMLAAGALCLLATPRLLAQCSINIGNDTVVCQGTQAQLHGPPGFSNYLWNTGQVSQDISTGTAGNYWCQVTYLSGNLVTNGDFSSGNTGFSSQYIYSSTNLQNEGYYTVGTDAHNYHSQFQGTGTGNFLIANGGYVSWLNNQFDVWCQSVPVCPGQTYTLSYRARTLSNDLPARIIWRMDGIDQWPEATLPAYSAGWQNFTATWTAAAGQTSVNACLHVTSGDGVGDDFGIDDISISGTIVLSDTLHVGVTPLPVVNLGPDTTLCQGETLALNAAVPGGSYLWNDGVITASRNISSAGNFAVTVTAQGCSSSDQINVAVNPLPTFNLGPDTTLCVGNSINLSAAVPGASYMWSVGSAASTINVSTSGLYWAQADLNGCSHRDSVVVNFTPLPVVDLGNDTTLCQGQSLTLNATVPGGSYLWNDGVTTASRNISSAGNFAVTVTAQGCSSSDQINVAVNPLPTFNLGPDTTLCVGNSINLSAAVPGASYMWSVGSAASTINVSTSGLYWAQADLNGCSHRDSVVVNFTPLPVVDLGNDTTLCQGQSLTLNATVPGGSYLWNDGVTTASRNISSAGNFAVTVTAQGCSSSDQINVTVNPMPVVDLGSDTTLCTGNSITLSAAVPGATYLWSNATSAATLNVSTAGSYWAEADLNGCSHRDTILVSFTPLPVVDLGNDTTLCQGESLALNAAVPGGSYLWNDGVTTASRNITSAGNFAVTVTAQGCSSSDQINVTVNPVPVVDLGPDVVVCPGATATFDATVPGGTYLWNTGSTAASITMGTPGTYSVQVTVGGCSASDAVVLSNFSLQSANLGPDLSICAGQSQQIGLDIPGATYLWNTGATSDSIAVSTAGSVWVRATLNGCIASDTLNISVIPLPVVSLGPDQQICPGTNASLDATITGAAAYLWNTGATSPTISAGLGTWQVTVTQAGCSATDAVTISASPAPTVDLGPDTTLCNGNTITLSAATPGATFLWNDGSSAPTLSVATAGTYWVEADLNGCLDRDTVTVAFTTPPVVDLGPDTALCQGETLVLNATVPGAYYLWNDGVTSASRSIATSGNYSVVVTANGCASSDAINVVFGPAPTVDLGPDTTLCTGNTITLSAATPGAIFLWSNGSVAPTLAVATAGTYWVEADLDGCLDRDTVTVAFTTPPAVDLGPDTALCQGETLGLNAAVPGAYYLWNDGLTSASRSVTTSGNYSVVVTANGCASSDAINVVFGPAPTVDLGPDTALCGTNLLALNATSAGATYVWNDGYTQPQRTVGPGIWSVVATANGCSTSDNITITALPTPQAILPTDTTLCDGATWQPNVAQTGASYLWSTGATTPSIVVDQPGNFDVTISIGSCSASAQTAVSVVEMNAFTLGPDTTLCPGHSVTVGSNAPGVSVLWQDGYMGNMRTIEQPGNFQAQFHLAGCMAEDELAVQFTPLPTLNLGPDQVICEGDTLWLDPATGAAQFQWSNGDATLPLPINTTGPVVGQLTMAGCVSRDTVLVIVRPFVFTVDLGPDRSICADNTITLDAGIAGATYTWSDGSHLSTLLVDQPGEYRVQVEGTCISAVDTVQITQGRCATLVFVPNAFSPDGDGHNEVFLPSVSDLVDEWNFAVYNRWGERIFNTTAPGKGWDGTSNGKQAPVGVYVWTLHYEAITDEGVEQVQHRGSVTLLR